MVSLVQSLPVTISVSSTSDAKLFAKKCLIDGKDDTCWSSDQGDKQFLKIKFESTVTVNELRITFQGGFSSRIVRLTLGKNDQIIDTLDIHPQDVNSLQCFTIQSTICDTIKLDFVEFTDFYGRIDIIGEK